MHTMKAEAVAVIEKLPDSVDIDEIIRELRQFSLKKSMAQQENLSPIEPISFLEAAQKYIGCIEGPADLSTNKAYFKDFGR